MFQTQKILSTTLKNLQSDLNPRVLRFKIEPVQAIKKTILHINLTVDRVKAAIR